MTKIATLVCALGILGLFLLNRERKTRSSWALLLPFFWLLIAGSRNVGEWLESGNPTSGDVYVEGNALDRNLLTVVIAAGVVVLFQRREKIGMFLRANWPLLIYFFYCGVSLLWSDYPFVGFKRWIRAWGDVVMVLIVLTERDWLASRRRLYAWTAFVLIPASILLIRYYPELGRAYGLDGTLFWTGVGKNKNELGLICLVFGLPSVARLIDIYKGREGPGKTRALIAHVAIVVMTMYLLHVANSATSLACLGLGVGILLLTSWRPVIRRPALIHVIVASMLLFTFSSLFLNIGSGVVENLGRNSTLTGRTELWAHALKLVENPVFGAGYESFWVGSRLEQMRAFAMGVNQAHNGYLEIYLNLGWVGVTLLALVIVTGYRNVVAAFRRDPGPARLMLAYFVVAMAYNFTEGAFKFRNPVWISFLLAIMYIPQLASLKVRKTTAKGFPAQHALELPQPGESIYEDYV